MKIYIIERFAVIFHAGEKKRTSSTDIKEYKEIEVTQEFANSLLPANYIGLNQAYYEPRQVTEDMFLFETLYFFDASYFETIQSKYKNLHEVLDEEYDRFYDNYYAAAQFNR